MLLFHVDVEYLALGGLGFFSAFNSEYLRQLFSRCPQTIGTFIIWELVGNVYSQAPLQTTESLTCALTSPPGSCDSCLSLVTAALTLCYSKCGPLWISRGTWTSAGNTGAQGASIRTCILTRYPGDPDTKI